MNTEDIEDITGAVEFGIMRAIETFIDNYEIRIYEDGTILFNRKLHK